MAGLPAGVVADRIDPWRALIAADIVRTLIFVTLFACTGSASAQPWLILSLAAGAIASLCGGDPRPVIAGAGIMTLLTVVIAWLTGIRRQDAPEAAVALLRR